MNREENEAGEAAVSTDSDTDHEVADNPPIHHAAQNPDDHEQRKRLALFYMSPEGQIQEFDQNERIMRTSRREVRQDNTAV